MKPSLSMFPWCIRVFSICLGVIFSCAGATPDSTHASLPVETTFNGEAGRGGLLLVTIRLENAEDLTMVVDTGSPFCILDQSLAPGLGKPVDQYDIHSMYGVNRSELYRAPKLYLGGFQLDTGGTVAAMDCQTFSDGLNRELHTHYRIMGILGLECLRHYCVQFDFQNRKMRLLDPGLLERQNLGNAFPVTLGHFPAYVMVRGNLAGGRKTSSMVDTGMIFDGDISPKPLNQQTFFGKYRREDMVATNGVFGGNTYTNLSLGNGQANVLGLEFLARNLVTFNFPKKTMYLKQISAGPLTGGNP